jgi:hypothetical protein
MPRDPSFLGTSDWRVLADNAAMFLLGFLSGGQLESGYKITFATPNKN